MQYRTWSTLGTVALTLALMAAPSLAGKGGDKGKPGDGGGGDPPPPADLHIVYGEYDGTQWLLKQANADGTNQTLVLAIDNTGGVWPPNPSWSPDLSEIVFVAAADGSLALFVINADGTNLHKIVAGNVFTSLNDPKWSPTVAPDGEYKIAFKGVPDGVHGQIHVCNTDGSELVNITGDLTQKELGPTWSPDATRIAAGSRLSGGVRVYDLKADGSTVVKDAVADVTANTALDGANALWLDWAPSGDVIVMTVIDAQSNYDLWTLDVGDGATANLTATGADNESDPAWSPDGTKIVFRFNGSGKRRKQSGLSTINADGGSQTSLGIADGQKPDWN